MRNTLKFAHFVFVFIVLGCLWSFVLGSDSAVVKGQNKSRAILDSLRRQFAGFHANCVQTDWACSRSCRLQFPHNITGKCLKPALSDSCFGIPITYNYTYDNAIERELLPRYEVLKNFPRCWSAIGPLLCAVLYRPCSVRKYMEMEMDKPGLIELWQLIRRSVCYHAKNECSFLLKEGLWPEIINCSQLNVNSTRRRIFAESNCKMPYNEAPSTVHHHQCLWPLVSSYGSYQNAKPVLDNCYLPCKSSLISSQWLYNTFRSVLSIVSSLIFTLSFILFIYLSLFSSIWLESLCVYSLGNSLLCCSAHWGMWALSYFDRISSDIVCVDSGRIRKEHYNLPNGLLDWCRTQSWFLHFSLLAGYFWLSCFAILRIGRPRIREDHMLIYSDGSPKLNLRCALLCVYLFAGIIASLTPAVISPESDGISGVCSVGLTSVVNSMFVYIPILVVGVTSMALGKILQIRRKRCAMWSNARRKVENKKPIISNGDRPSSGDNIKGISHADTEIVPLSNGANLSSLNSKESVSSEKTGAKCPSYTTLLAITKQRFSYMAPSGCGHEAISHAWLCCLCFVMLAAVIFSLCTRIRIGSGGQVERNSVLASVRCSLKHTIEEGNIEWMDSQVHADRLSRSLDPLGRRAETGSRFLWAPKCELKPTLDNVLGYLFLTFIVFPSSPFICVILCIFAGFVGYGMVGIRRIRNNLNPFILDTDSESDDECENSSSKRNLCNDIEMTTLSGEIINQTPKTDAVTASVHSSASLKNTSTADLASDSLQALSGSAVANSSSSRVRRLDVARRARAHRLSMRFGSAPSFLSAEAARQAVLDENSASMSSVQTSSYSAQCPMSDGTFNMPSASQNQMLAVESSSIISAYERGLMQAEILNQQAQWQQSCAAQLSEMTNAMGQACQELKKLFNLISSNVDDQLSSTSVFNGEPISFEGTSSLKPTLSADGSMNNASVEPAEKASRVLRKSDIPAKSVTEEDVFKGAELKERNNGLEEARITGTVEDTVLTNSGDHLTEISSSNTGVSVDSNTFCSDEEDSEEEKACQRLLDKKEEPYDDAGSNEHNFFEIAAEYQSDSDGQSDEEHNEISGTSIPRRTVATETDQDSQISEHIRMQSENSFRNSTELSPSTSGVVVRPGLMRDVSSRPVHAQHSHQSDHRFSGLNELNVQPPHNIILTPEQRIRLNQYRQQLSVRDLLNYSEFMRRLAYRQAQMEGIRIGIQPISNERAPFIPEEDEEEVADPSSSTSDLAAGFIRAAEFSNKGPKKKDREE